jgi:hypothetical protein
MTKHFGRCPKAGCGMPITGYGIHSATRRIMFRHREGWHSSCPKDPDYAQFEEAFSECNIQSVEGSIAQGRANTNTVIDSETPPSAPRQPGQAPRIDRASSGN